MCDVKIMLMLRQERQYSQHSTGEETELAELELENVTSDIKEWLTSTFATKQQVRLRASLSLSALSQ